MTPPLSALTAEIAQLVHREKAVVAHALREAGRSRLARQVLTLPCAEAASIQHSAFGMLPIAADALALAAASAAIEYTTTGHISKACNAADVALIMLGPLTGAPFLRLISCLQTDAPPPDVTLFADDLKLVSDSDAVPNSPALPPNLSAVHCDTLQSPTAVTDFAPYFTADKPVVLAAMARDWTACRKWASPHYLASRHGHRVVPIEYVAAGSHVMEEKLCTISQLLAAILHMHSVIPSDIPPDGTVYLAQHPIFDYIPELKADIKQPHLLQVANKTVADVINVWMGSATSGSKLHYDSADNFLVQLVGHKTVVLIDPSQRELLYLEHTQQNVSPLNLNRVDLSVHPLFNRVIASTITLHPGDTLYIPAGHWHWVKAATASISVNFWF